MASPLTGSAAAWYVILAQKKCPPFASLSYSSSASVEMTLDTSALPWNTVLWQPQYRTATWDNGYFVYKPDLSTNPSIVYLPDIFFKQDLTNFNTSYAAAEDNSLDSISIFRYRILVGSTWSGWSDYEHPILPPTAGGGGGNLDVHTKLIGNGSATNFSITHNLSTTSVSVTVSETSTGEIVYPSVTVVNSGLVQVSFSSPPSTNEYKVVIIG